MCWLQAPGGTTLHYHHTSHLHTSSTSRQLGHSDTYCSQMWRCVIEDLYSCLKVKGGSQEKLSFLELQFALTLRTILFAWWGMKKKLHGVLTYITSTRACQRCFLESVIWSNICRARVSGAGRSVNNVNVSIVCTVCILGSYYYALSPAWPHQRNSFVLMTCAVEASTMQLQSLTDWLTLPHAYELSLSIYL